MGSSKLFLTIVAHKPCNPQIALLDPTKPNTYYHIRGVGDDKFVGERALEFRFPIEPQKLRITQYCKNNTKGHFEIKGISHEKWDFNPTPQPDNVEEFLQFAQDFSHKAGYLKIGTYFSKTGKYKINFKPEITDPETGKVVNTPAWVNHATGLIEVREKEFKYLTVTNRMLVLCHEFSHFILNTRDEFLADKCGADLMINRGYSPIECVYALIRLFGDVPDDKFYPYEKRIIALQNHLSLVES